MKTRRLDGIALSVLVEFVVVVVLTGGAGAVDVVPPVAHSAGPRERSAGALREVTHKRGTTEMTQSARDDNEQSCRRYYSGYYICVGFLLFV